MAQSESAQKTEKPTARRLRNAREEGQIARSREVPAAAITIAGVLIIFMMGPTWVQRLSHLMAEGFRFDAKALQSPNLLASIFAGQLIDAFVLMTPLFAVTAVVAVLASGITGGFNFTWNSVLPKASKFNPLTGLGRIFGTHALVELLKSLGKFALVGAVLYFQVQRHLQELLNVGNMALQPALALAGGLISESVLWLSLSLLIVAMIDAPYQRWSFINKLKMSKQEIKDEMKDMEGRPEVKQKIRRRQREIAMARMMQKVKDADVVITNPEHFAVALSYNPAADGAPMLLAKGVDFTAQRIREEAKTHGVVIFEAPPLARALYFTTDLDRSIPEALYHAVAPIIAYVYSLSSFQSGGQAMPKPHPEVPRNMRFNADGQPEFPEGTDP
jgi:flagellar biosynthetic protein FlhB